MATEISPQFPEGDHIVLIQPDGQRFDITQDVISIGFDGSLKDDATAIVLKTVDVTIALGCWFNDGPFNDALKAIKSLFEPELPGDPRPRKILDAPMTCSVCGAYWRCEHQGPIIEGPTTE